MHAAATVVVDDGMLQKAILVEQQSLLSKGAFTPTLKSSSNSKQDNKGSLDFEKTMLGERESIFQDPIDAA